MKELNKLNLSYHNKRYDEIEQIIDALSIVPGSTVDQKLKALQAQWKRDGVAAKSHEDFKLLVGCTNDLFAVTGPKAIAKDLARLKEIFCSGQVVSADELVSALVVNATMRRVAPTSSVRVLDPLLYSDELIKNIEHELAFEKLVTDLFAQRMYTLAQINAVARHFLGYDAGFRSKAKAEAAIRTRQADMIIGGAQIKQIAGLRI
jgi:hypothetical protein